MMSAYPEVLLWKAYNKGKGVTDNIEVAVNRGNTYTGSYFMPATAIIFTWQI